MRWQVKLPDAVFDLEPLLYDPDRALYTDGTVLESPDGDRVQVLLEGKTEGKLITIRVLELDGSPDYEPIRVVVTQQKSSRVAAISRTQLARRRSRRRLISAIGSGSSR